MKMLKDLEIIREMMSNTYELPLDDRIMALNPFLFKELLVNEFSSRSHQRTVEMYGVECYYLPRQYATTDNVIKEVISSDFNYSYPIGIM